MLVAGLHNGNIAVYNLQRDTGKPSHESSAQNGKHKDVVWEVGTSILIIAPFLFLECR